MSTVFATLPILLAVGLLAGRAARALRVPDIPLILIAGLLAGPVLGLVHVEPTATFAGSVLAFGASFMLYEGGRRLPLAAFREIGIGVGLLAVLGVLVTAGLLTLVSHALLGLPWAEAALLAAVLAPTDPATIIPLFEQVRIRTRLAFLVEAEAGFNDAVAAILTSGLAVLALHGGGAVPDALAFIGAGLPGGAAVGIVVGALVAWLLPGGRGGGILDRRAEGVLLALIAVLAAFGGAEAVGGSGYLAAFLAGIVVGNRHTLGLARPPRQRLQGEAHLSDIATLVRILVFAVLGAAVQLQHVRGVLAPALALVALLLFVFRPLAVLICLPPDRRARWTWGEIGMTSWVRETGVIPAALAGLLLQERVPDAEIMAAVVFVAVLVTIVVQVPTTHWWARQMRVTETAEAEEA